MGVAALRKELEKVVSVHFQNLGELVSGQRLSTNPAEVFQESRGAALLLWLPWPGPEALSPGGVRSTQLQGWARACSRWGMQA